MASTIAAQLYTVRQYTQTPAEIAATLRRVKQIGYDAVQCSALGPIEAGDLKRILDGEGLVCCATHEPYEALRDNPNAVIEKLRTINCRFTALGAIPQAHRGTVEGFGAFAREFSGIARRLGAAGIRLGYHNHHWELQRLGDRTALRILMEECDPAIFFEVDTYWIQAGGGDPAQWIRKLKGRIPLVHLKDMTYGVDRTGAEALKANEGETEAELARRKQEALQPKGIMAEVGEGNLNWPEILRACGESGVRWHIIELDTCQRDPFESLGIALRNLRGMGVK